MNTPTFFTLKEAIKAVPAVKYALGVAGVAAVVAIVSAFKLNHKVAVFGTIIMFGLMFLLVLFSWFSKNAGKHAKMPTLVLVWTFVLLTLITATLLLSSFFFHWPRPLDGYVSAKSLEKSEESSRVNPSPLPTVSVSPSPVPSKAPNRDVNLNSSTKASVSGHVARARGLYEKGAYEAALAECDKALALDPSNTEAALLKTKVMKTREILNR
jgi:tetratricopeptide (TPR) repeat protein